jgi:hypothetical protein
MLSWDHYRQYLAGCGSRRLANAGARAVWFLAGCSDEFVRLVFRVRELRDIFLPDEPEPTGSYEPAIYDRVRAFILLCHAELEDYLEQVAISVLNDAKAKWDLDGVARGALLAVLAFSKNRVTLPPGAVTPGPSTLRQVVDDCVAGFANDIFRSNHGIKEENVLALLLPVGIRETDISTTWLASMSSFAATRGSHAHRSASATTLPDPFDTLTNVIALAEGLRSLDLKLIGLRNE